MISSRIWKILITDKLLCAFPGMILFVCVALWYFLRSKMKGSLHYLFGRVIILFFCNGISTAALIYNNQVAHTCVLHMQLSMSRSLCHVSTNTSIPGASSCRTTYFPPVVQKLYCPSFATISTISTLFIQSAEFFHNAAPQGSILQYSSNFKKVKGH